MGEREYLERYKANWCISFKTATSAHRKKMENFLNNPGLKHLTEKIFLNLNSAHLKKCQMINQSASQILETPMFWIKKLIRNGLSEENQNDWIKAIQSETNFEKKKNIVDYLSWNSKKKTCFDLPCYTKPVAQEDFWNRICKAAKRSIDRGKDMLKWSKS